jgi:hypothetical protein
MALALQIWYKTHENSSTVPENRTNDVDWLDGFRIGTDTGKE